MDEPLREQGSASTPERLHEESHINTRAAALGGLALLAFLAVMSFAMFGHYAWLRSAWKETPARRSLKGSPVFTQAAPLLADPAEELRRVRAEQEAALDGYAWVDEQRAIVRIPINRAMDLLAERGLNAIGPWTEAASTTGVTTPTAPRSTAP